MRKILIISALFVALLESDGPLAATAAAEWKPTKSVTVVVPFSPGGGTDFESRKSRSGRDAGEEWFEKRGLVALRRSRL